MEKTLGSIEFTKVGQQLRENQATFDLLKTFTPRARLWSTNQKKISFSSSSASFLVLLPAVEDFWPFPPLKPSLLHIRARRTKSQRSCYCIMFSARDLEWDRKFKLHACVCVYVLCNSTFSLHCCERTANNAVCSQPCVTKCLCQSVPQDATWGKHTWAWVSATPSKTLKTKSSPQRQTEGCLLRVDMDFS